MSSLKSTIRLFGFTQALSPVPSTGARSALAGAGLSTGLRVGGPYQKRLVAVSTATNSPQGTNRLKDRRIVGMVELYDLKRGVAWPPSDNPVGPGLRVV